MTTTELIELLKRNEKGGVSHKSREISLTINGKYMSNPQISLSSTGDGICGAEIDLDIVGDFFIEEEPKAEWIPISKETPKKCGWYITSTIYNEVFCDYWNGDAFDRTETVLAWQEKPLPYRVESEGKKMDGSFELTLNNPLTKEDWDKIMDVELENTPSVTFQTPKGKQVKYIKSDILDKIIAEIKQTFIDDAAMQEYTVEECLRIIDKYKESDE